MSMKQVLLSTLVLIGLTGILFLWRAVEAGDQAATAVAASLVTLALVGVGVGLTLLVTWFAYKHEEQRAARDQQAFVANARENLAILQSASNAQAAQIRAQAAMQRALPAPGETVDSALIFNDAVFEELEK